MKNVLIIGNGFDLDLGLPTSYKDFAKSTFWPKPIHNAYKHSTFSVAAMQNYHSLGLALERKRETTDWFDIEETLLEYATKEIKPLGNSQYSPEDDLEYYEILRSSLCDYLIDVQDNTELKAESLAGDVLKAVLANGYFKDIYSFNYTDLNYLAGEIGINQTINYTHIHGKLSDRSIILGVNETKLQNGYNKFQKSISDACNPSGLINALEDANEVVFFGVSLGIIDYSYFKRFFEYIGSKRSKNNNKTHISFFTKDENSQLSIIEILQSQEISITDLRSNAHLQFYYTQNTDSEKLQILFQRLKDNSQEAHSNFLKSIESRIR